MARALSKDPEAAGKAVGNWAVNQAVKTGGLGGELGVNYQGKMWGWGAASAFGINSGAGAAIGAATNGDDRLKGALWGGAIGGGLGLAGRGALTMALRDTELRAETMSGLGKMGFGEVHGPFRTGQTSTMSKPTGGGIEDAVNKANATRGQYSSGRYNKADFVVGPGGSRSTMSARGANRAEGDAVMQKLRDQKRASAKRAAAINKAEKAARGT
jgi:hypothetical protein